MVGSGFGFRVGKWARFKMSGSQELLGLVTVCLSMSCVVGLLDKPY